MNKLIHFSGKTEHGILAQGLFAGAFEKTAGAPPFADLDTGDELRAAVKQILARNDQGRYCYVLVNALGAGEWYGSNINADWFPWNSLAHEGEDYGYKTFLNAHAFAHHKNKDPARAFGVPIVSLLNPRMKRIELIIQLDREKAKFEGADGIINRIDAGEFPDVSMGCKVPWDECSICANRSKTRDDYCICMRPPPELRHELGPNKILADGRQIFVKNIYPRFFDISFVFIGADKTAKVMAKLAMAQSGLWVPAEYVEGPELSADAGYRFYIDLGAETAKVKTASAPCPNRSCSECDRHCGGMSKLAMAFGKPKVAHKKKLADIIKEIPAGTFSTRVLPRLERREPRLPKKALTKLSAAPLCTALGATTALGIVLHPDEFQDIVLTKMGEADLRDQLEREHGVFREVNDTESINLETGAPVGELLEQVIPEMEDAIRERTAFGEPFALRVGVPPIDMKKALPTSRPVAHSLLDKVSAAYNGYRRDLLMKLSSATGMVQSDPKLREVILGNELAGMFTKTSSSVQVITPDSVAYFMGAHFSDRGRLHTTAVARAMTLCNDGLLQDEELEAQGF